MEKEVRIVIREGKIDVHTGDMQDYEVVGLFTMIINQYQANKQAATAAKTLEELVLNANEKM